MTEIAVFNNPNDPYLFLPKNTEDAQRNHKMTLSQLKMLSDPREKWDELFHEGELLLGMLTILLLYLLIWGAALVLDPHGEVGRSFHGAKGSAWTLCHGMIQSSPTFLSGKFQPRL